MLLYLGEWDVGGEEIEILSSFILLFLSTVVTTFETHICFNGISEFVSVGNLG